MTRMEERDKYWQDPSKISEGCLPVRSHFIPYSTIKLANQERQEEDPFFLSLNGNWKFNWSRNFNERPSDFWKRGNNTESWDNILVPASWQTQGFGTPIYRNKSYPFATNPPKVDSVDNPVGSYVKSFHIDESWSKRDIILTFEGVSSAAFFWVNGSYLGYHQDSKNRIEFDITDYIVIGENKISVEVFRYCDGSYLECQDFWRLSGIERNVYVTARSSHRIDDINLTTSLSDDFSNGTLNCEVTVNSEDVEGAINFILSRDERIICQGRIPIVERTVSWLMNVSKVDLWSAEIPSLYRLQLHHVTKKGETLEVINSDIGFRSVKIIDGLLCVNGKPVTIRGVNHHEHDQWLGRYLTDEDMEKDILLMKKYHFNAVRNSHYPKPPKWYELCDRHGLYVCDEANIESHAMGANFQEEYDVGAHVSQIEGWQEAHLTRVKNMYKMSKNHPSVIIWSIGNEAGNGKHMKACYDWLRSKDKSRPIQYEQAGLEYNTDIYAPMYPLPQDLVDYASQKTDRPLIMCEYAHAMGNSLGNYKEYWDLINRYDNLQGGFIWDWHDQGLAFIHSDGEIYWKYGGDFEDHREDEDYNFCINGILFPDRTPHPCVHEVVSCMQPITISWSMDGRKQISIFSRYDFLKIAGCKLIIDLIVGGRVIEDYHVPLSLLTPGDLQLVSLPSEMPELKEVESFLNCRVVDKYDEVIAQEQLSYSDSKSAHFIIKDEESSRLIISENNSSIVIEAVNRKYSFSKNSGALVDLSYQGKSLFVKPVDFCFWRAPVDNDFGHGAMEDSIMWRDAGRKMEMIDSFEIEKRENEVFVRANVCFPEVFSSGNVEYVIADNGTIKISYDLQLICPDGSEIPRVGIYTQLLQGFTKLEYYGRGPFENYVDRKSAAQVGRYKQDVSSFHESYISAQENGNRCDVRHCTFKNSSEERITIIGHPTFDMTVSPYTREELTRSHWGEIHEYELRESNDVHLHLDMVQKGVGGIDSWESPPLSKYRYFSDRYATSITIYVSSDQ